MNTEPIPGADPGDIVEQVQDTVLPKGLPAPQGVDIDARYLMAVDPDAAGGDWFDASPLADGRVLLAVGDIAGHGLEASIAMAEVKVLLAERVREDGNLAAALTHLDRRAARAPGTCAATVCVGLLDPESGRLDYCTAGHPPPIVVDADGAASYLPASGAGPLGSGSDFVPARHDLEDGGLVVLYSDGLLDLPGRPTSQSTLELLNAVADSLATDPHRPVDRVCESLLAIATRGAAYRDDVTVLAAQRVPRTPPLELELAALPDALRVGRLEVGRWLGALGVSAIDEVALQHTVGELMANAVEHAYDGPDRWRRICVRLRLDDQGVVEVEVLDTGSWREHRVRHRPALGLAMARAFVDELEIRTGAGGTTATARVRITRPAEMLRGSADRPPPPLGHDIEADDDRAVVTARGGLNRDAVTELARVVHAVSRVGARPITVDLTEVVLLSSVAVQLLISAREQGEVRLVAPLGSAAQHVLDVVRLPYVHGAA